MPKTYLLKKLDPFALIWKNRQDDDQLRFCGDSEEEARRNTATFTQIPGKPLVPSPWKDPRLTSCEMEHDGEVRSGDRERNPTKSHTAGSDCSP